MVLAVLRTPAYTGRTEPMLNSALSHIRHFAIVALLLGAIATAQSAPFDVLITNGHIIDGTGSPWYSGDIGIRDGRVAAIGKLAGAPAKQTIDAHGMVVA